LMVSYDLDFVGGIKTTNKWIHMDGTLQNLSLQNAKHSQKDSNGFP